MKDAGDLDEALKAAGVPIVGVVLRRLGPPVDAYVQYAPSATATEKKKGDALLKHFDWGAAETKVLQSGAKPKSKPQTKSGTVKKKSISQKSIRKEQHNG